MATQVPGKRVTDLDAITGYDANDLIMVVDTSATQTKKMTMSSVMTNVIAQTYDTIKQQILDDVAGYVFVIDPDATDQGDDTEVDTVAWALTQISATDNAVFLFRHTGAAATTSYAVGTSIDMSTYTGVSCVFMQGAYLTVANTKTVTFNNPLRIIATPDQQIFSGDGTITFDTNGIVFPGWWGAVFDPGDDSTDCGDAFNAALATGCDMVVPKGVYSTTTTIVQDTSRQAVYWQDMDLRVNADVVGWQIGVTGGTSQVGSARTIGSGIIENVFGSSTKAGILLETCGNCIIEAYKSVEFKYPIEFYTSDTKNCTGNFIFVKYLKTTGDETADKHIYIHNGGAGGTAYNNSIHEPTMYGNALYGIHIDTSGGLASNTHIYHPLWGPSVMGRAIKDTARGTFVLGGHYEVETTVGETLTIDGTYTWALSGSGTAEYYITSAKKLPNGVCFRSDGVVNENSTPLNWNATLGSLASGDFGWGDNDSLGFNTLYVRLSDDTAPAANEVDVFDANYIHLTSDSQNCSYRVTHYTVQSITDEGTNNSFENRNQLWKDFQMGGNYWYPNMRLRRYSATVKANENQPLVELDDVLATSGSESHVIQTRTSKNTSASSHLRCINDSTGAVTAYIDGAGDIKHIGTHIPGSVISNVTANTTFGPTDGNVFMRNNTAAGARNLNPSGTFIQGHWIILVETGGAQSIVFDSTGLNATVAAGKMGLFVYNGTAWKGSQIN